MKIYELKDAKPEEVYFVPIGKKSMYLCIHAPAETGFYAGDAYALKEQELKFFMDLKDADRTRVAPFTLSYIFRIWESHQK